MSLNRRTFLASLAGAVVARELPAPVPALRPFAPIPAASQCLSLESLTAAMEKLHAVTAFRPSIILVPPRLAPIAREVLAGETWGIGEHLPDDEWVVLSKGERA